MIFLGGKQGHELALYFMVTNGEVATGEKMFEVHGPMIA